MNTLDIRGYKKQIKFPSCIDEMTTKQYTEYIKLFLLLRLGKISLNDFVVRNVISLLNLKIIYAYKSYGFNVKSAINDNFRIISQSLDWLYNKEIIDGKEQIEPNISFVTNHIKNFKGLYGPDDGFVDLTIAEYKHALGANEQFANSNNEADLDNLVAILYRKSFVKSRIRRFFGLHVSKFRYDFDSSMVPFIQKKIAKWPFEVKYGIYLWFNACRNNLKNGIFKIEGRETSFAPLFEGGEYSGDSVGMDGVIFSLAESGVFGNIKQTYRANVFDVFLRLLQLKYDEIEFSRKMKNHGKDSRPE